MLEFAGVAKTFKDCYNMFWMVQKSSLIVEKLQYETNRYTWAHSRFYMLTCKKTQDVLDNKPRNPVIFSDDD